ncbi:alpha/beta fold hydrolase [uncultured Hymenobacter sp.]|uniref:alpha/beta fold hydrolase n=1 Tax=uncultured Hymenobacter sp. TaxID=170016 RepID=UPI0035CB4D3C
MARLFLLHGYVEDRTIFDPLRPLLPSAARAALVDVELEDAFGKWQPRGPLNAATLATHLIRLYQIRSQDVLIGHSMGGWIAAHIKQQVGCPVVLLGAFTDQAKIVSKIRSPLLLGLAVKTGLIHSQYVVRRTKRNYRRDESRALHAQLTDGMTRYGRRYVHQQLLVLFAPAPPLTITPELRLHARRDNIIRPPDEPYVELPGDHFAHYYYPQAAAEAIARVLAEAGVAGVGEER